MRAVDELLGERAVEPGKARAEIDLERVADATLPSRPPVAVISAR